MSDDQLAADSLAFLKLGGSLITEKSRPQTLRPAVLQRLCREIAGGLSASPGLRLVLGHGSGSFGHTVASQYGTRQGVQTQDQWSGFAEVWRQAATLNHQVMQALHREGIPALAFPASASAVVRDVEVQAWELGPLLAGLNRGLLPVVYGDVAFDHLRGGTILSTEDIFVYLAGVLRPRRILLAGMEAGVWSDYPDRRKLIAEVTPQNVEQVLAGMPGAAGPDVTGGMAGKIRQMVDLACRFPEIEIRIFSGENAGTLQRVLAGGQAGTRVGAGTLPG
jgi:isopentenyl phosphate kinase